MKRQPETTAYIADKRLRDPLVRGWTDEQILMIRRVTNRILSHYEQEESKAQPARLSGTP